MDYEEIAIVEQRTAKISKNIDGFNIECSRGVKN
jgi:hypothetical protein